MQVAMGGSSQYVIGALVLVCLLRKAEAQSECMHMHSGVMCLATTAEAAILCSAACLLGCMQVYLFLQLSYLVIFACCRKK